MLYFSHKTTSLYVVLFTFNNLSVCCTHPAVLFPATPYAPNASRYVRHFDNISLIACMLAATGYPDHRSHMINNRGINNSTLGELKWGLV